MELLVRETWLSRRPRPSAGAIASFATLLLVIGSVIFWRDPFGLSSILPASGDAVFAKGEYWRAWTTLFVHADEKHLLANSFLFYLIGTFLTGYFGTFVFPVMAFLFGGLTNLLVLSGMPADIRLVGASGVVFWMGGAWLVLYALLDRRRTVSQRALRSIGVGLVLFMPAEAFDPHVSYMAHLIGFLLGIAWAVVYYALRVSEFRAAEVYQLPETSSDQIA